MCEIIYLHYCQNCALHASCGLLPVPVFTMTIQLETGNIKGGSCWVEDVDDKWWFTCSAAFVADGV
jgi:hypothetical protein